MNEKILQNVMNELQNFLPKAWARVVFYAGYTMGSYSMKYYIDCGDGNYIDCFNQSGISHPQLIKLFIDIDKELSSEREILEDAKKWTVLTMIVDSEGNMKTDFDYANISENPIEYERNWKKKYLQR